MTTIQKVKDWAYIIKTHYDKSGKRRREYLRRATDKELEEFEKAKEEQKTLVSISCTNPKCDRIIKMPRQQKQKLFTTFPLRYGHFSLPYCCKECQESHTKELAPIIDRKEKK